MDGNGDSLNDCVTKCTSSIDREADDDDDRSRSSSEAPIIGESDCECYCSMIHDPCNEELPTITGMYLSRSTLSLSLDDH